jgi:hypothetical protein
VALPSSPPLLDGRGAAAKVLDGEAIAAWYRCCSRL